MSTSSGLHPLFRYLGLISIDERAMSLLRCSMADLRECNMKIVRRCIWHVNAPRHVVRIAGSRKVEVGHRARDHRESRFLRVTAQAISQASTKNGWQWQRMIKVSEQTNP